ncbi:hypothetical protein PTKU46_80390 [Paraburkholderia terrae]
MAEGTGSSVSGTLCQDAGTIGWLFAGTTSIVGTGWFSDPFHVSKIARPLRFWNRVAGGGWRVAGAIIIVPIAVCFAIAAAICSTSSERENARRFESHSSFPWGPAASCH